MSNKYTMKETMDIAKQASKEIEAYLLSLPQTLSVENVEDDELLQMTDVDLAWLTTSGLVLIEIKGDRYHHTGNYFFETISNKEKDTLGCFLYTAADFIYYYFVEEKELHIMPTNVTRDWFVANMHRFEEKSVKTKVRGDYYTTVGRVVPRRLVRNVKVVKLSP